MPCGNDHEERMLIVKRCANSFKGRLKRAVLRQLTADFAPSSGMKLRSVYSLQAKLKVCSSCTLPLLAENSD